MLTLGVLNARSQEDRQSAESSGKRNGTKHRCLGERSELVSMRAQARVL